MHPANRPWFESSSALRASLTGMAAALAVAVTGCRTVETETKLPTIRSLRAEVGVLRYEEAVRRLGPPARRIELGDHSIIAEWEAGTESSPSFTLGLGSSSGAADTTTGPTVGGGVYHRFRQLQFDPGQRLVEVQDIRR